MKKNWLILTSAIFVLTLVFLVAMNQKDSEFSTPDKLIRYRFKSLAIPKLDDHIAFYQKKIKAAPWVGMEWALLGGVYFEKGKLTGISSWFDKAEEAAQTSLRNMSIRNSAAKALLARVAEAKHDFARAVSLATEVHNENPSSSEGLAIRISANLGWGKLEEAAIDADDLVDKKPSSSSYLLRALVMEARGRISEALFDFHKSLSLEDVGDPEGAAYRRTLLGRFHLHRGNLKTARKLFREALRIVRDYPLALGLSAELEARNHDYTAADKYYYEAFLRVKDPTFLINQARMKAITADLSSADQLRQQAEAMLREELTRGSYGHRLQLATLLLDRGRPDDIAEAIRLAEQEAKGRRNAETLSVLSWALGSGGHWLRAHEVIREVLRSGVENAEFFYRAGIVEQNLRNLSLAKFYFHRALQINPRYEEAKLASRSLPSQSG